VLAAKENLLAEFAERNLQEYLARPERLELPTLWFEDTQHKILSAAAGVAYEEARHLSRP